MQYLLTLLLLVSSFIFSSEEEAKECADIEDTTQRLSCYDSLFAPQQIEDPKLVITQKKQEVEITKQDKEIKKEVKNNVIDRYIQRICTFYCKDFENRLVEIKNRKQWIV